MACTWKSAPRRLDKPDDPKMFGINQDDRFLATRLAVAAPEIVHHEGQDYMVALTPELDGLQIARLSWLRPPKAGPALWDFDDQEVRRAWSVESGHLPGPFTTSNRSDFNAPQDHFIGTAEVEGGLDDTLTVRLRSPDFIVSDTAYFALLSGGSDASVYFALVDVDTEREIRRIGNTANSNAMQPHLIPTDQLIGRRVYVRIVDESKDGWGHINFGGLYTVLR